jgi:uncharacterized membrane protein YqgA involved in biofilm formation
MHPYRQHPTIGNTCEVCEGTRAVHERAEDSRDRDERFAKRFLFVLLFLAAFVHGISALFYVVNDRPTLLVACVTVDAVVALVATLVWWSGKIIK